MATSRTGTAKWKRVVRERLRLAQIQGITRCPTCGCALRYVKRDLANYQPDRAEVDHIVAHEDGGPDTLENSRVICSDALPPARKGGGQRIRSGCNKKRRSRERRAAFATKTWQKPRTSREW